MEIEIRFGKSCGFSGKSDKGSWYWFNDAEYYVRGNQLNLYIRHNKDDFRLSAILQDITGITGIASPYVKTVW